MTLQIIMVYKCTFCFECNDDAHAPHDLGAWEGGVYLC